MSLTKTMNIAAGKDPLQGLETAYIHDTKNAALLDRGMELFDKTWPEYAGVETAEGFLENIDNPDNNWKPFIMLLGRNLDEPEKAEIVGFRYALYFPESQTSLLVYLAVDEKYRDKGIGHAMVNETVKGLDLMAQKDGKPLNGVFFEINDPAKVSIEEDSIDPAVRKQIFEKWGAKQMPVDYVQPPWEEGAEQTSKFLLMAHKINDALPGPEATKNFLHDLYKDYAGLDEATVQENPAFNNMIAQLDTPALSMDKKPAALPTQKL